MTSPTGTRAPDATAAPGQVRLPGQAAAPDGPVDLTVMLLVHHALRRDLAAFAAAVPATPVDDRRTWQALHARWERFAEVLHSHHTGEDTGLWPLLLERVDAAGRQVLEDMEAEHAVLDPLLAACAEGLAAMPERGSTDLRAALTVRTTAVRDALHRHLAHEERDALALVQRHLSQDDWERMERASFSRPRTPGEVAFLVPWVLAGVPAVIRRRALAGERAFAVVHVLTRRRFARRERRAFGRS